MTDCIIALSPILIILGAFLLVTLVRHLRVIWRWLGNREHRQIVCVEPSMFRRNESYVLGPFNIYKAWKVANREVRIHPFGEAIVTHADNQLVTQGNRVLWDTELRDEL